MIDEARRLPPSMVVVAIIFVSLFFVLATGTILAVVADDSIEGPSLEDLPLNGGAEVVDAMATCTDSACDGHGVLLMGTEYGADALAARLGEHWQRRGWEPSSCVDDGDFCFADDDLRISVRTWDRVDPTFAPTFVEGVADRQLDPRRLLYIHYFRCGIIHACE
jgi:hypothetical protein